MSKSLLVVESPTKARTIGKFLGKDFNVVATVGHLRDLPTSKMGVDLNNFDIDYVVDPKKKKVVSELLSSAKKSGSILLATDPDREGEAIAWHVEWIIKEKIKDKKQIKRVSFHEITQSAIEEALSQKREVDMNLVNAQQGRRVLDRVVGYSLSPVLWKKVRRGLSAGRVQSVAVRLIVEREKEIAKFLKEKYFKIWVQLAKEKNKFRADLIKLEGKNVSKTEKMELFDGNYSYGKTIFDSLEKTNKFISGLEKSLVVERVAEREVKRSPLPPFTTSKLQQTAARRFGWSGKQTMSVAQRLYEKGLITYHRTDSVFLSEKAVGEFRLFIENKYGSQYLSSKVRLYKNKAKNTQEAHEAIRPTQADRTELSGGDIRERKLYEMIWKRAVATQAASARMKNTTIDFKVDKALFQSKGVRMLFEGFLKISGEKHEDQILPELKVGERLPAEKYAYDESETNPPPRYSEASLVASLERQGIGRPSTYAPIISTIQLRQYVEKDEGRFKSTALGEAVSDFLVKNFPDILSLPFTADMEDDLDEVSRGELEWKEMMKKFWKTFQKEVGKVEKEAERVKIQTESIGEKCPECKEGDLVIRVGRFGKFISCDRFPECKYTRQYKEAAGFKCPECGAEGIIKRTKTGRRFYGCSKYPKCKWAGWKKP